MFLGCLKSSNEAKIGGTEVTQRAVVHLSEQKLQCELSDSGLSSQDCSLTKDNNELLIEAVKWNSAAELGKESMCQQNKQPQQKLRFRLGQN